MSEEKTVQRFMVAGFPNGELVTGEVKIPNGLAHPEAFVIEAGCGVLRLSRALRLREVPLPAAGVAGVKIKVETPILEFLPSDAKKIEDVIRPASVNTNLAHWVVELTAEQFDTFLKSINAPSSLFSVPPGTKVAH